MNLDEYPAPSAVSFLGVEVSIVYTFDCLSAFVTDRLLHLLASTSPTSPKVDNCTTTESRTSLES